MSQVPTGTQGGKVMILFFYGPNTYAARQQIARLTAEYERKSGGTLGIERLDGSKTKADELRASLTAAPFLSKSRLVIVEDLGGNKSVAPDIEKHLKDLPETTVAVFYDPQVDQRTAYFKTLTKLAKAIKFEPLDSGKLQAWVAREASAGGATIEPAAVRRLLELAGDDQWRLHHEIAKLSAASNSITLNAVNQMVEESYSETVFNLVEAMTAGQAGKALELHRKLRAAGQNEIYLLSMILWQVRNLLLAKAAGRVSAAELAKAAGMSPFVAGKMLSKRHLFSESQLKAAFLEAVETDYLIKSGGGAPEALVEQLLYRLASGVTETSRPRTA